MEDGYVVICNGGSWRSPMTYFDFPHKTKSKITPQTEEQLEIQRLKKANKELYVIIENLEELLAGFTNRERVGNPEDYVLKK